MSLVVPGRRSLLRGVVAKRIVQKVDQVAMIREHMRFRL